MFKNISDSVKGIAKATFVIELIGIALHLILTIEAIEDSPELLLAIVYAALELSALVAFVQLIYAFGVLVESSQRSAANSEALLQAKGIPTPSTEPPKPPWPPQQGYAAPEPQRQAYAPPRQPEPESEPENSHVFPAMEKAALEAELATLGKFDFGRKAEIRVRLDAIDAQIEEEIGRALDKALRNMASKGLPHPTSGTITVSAFGLQFSQPDDFSAFEAAFSNNINVSNYLPPTARVRYRLNGYTVTILK